MLLVDPDRMSILNLVQYVQHLRENQQQSNRYEIALWKKLVYPLAVIVMMALALPFAYLQARAGGIGYKVFAGIMLGIAFHFLNGLFSHLGLLNTWPPMLSAGIPSILFAAWSSRWACWPGSIGPAEPCAAPPRPARRVVVSDSSRATKTWTPGGALI